MQKLEAVDDKKRLVREKIEFGMDMYDQPPDDPYTLSRLLEVSKQRIDTYKKIESFLEEHRANEDESKSFYEDLIKAIHSMNHFTNFSK